VRRRFYTTPIKVSSAHFIATPPHGLRVGGGTAAHRRGHKHEDNVALALASDFVIHGPWLSYCTTNGRISTCQPDFLVFQPDRGRIVIVEAKLRHCAEAYFQLRNLYLPIIRHLFPAWLVGLQEVVQWYDKFEHFPGEHVLRRGLADAPPTHLIGVHILGEAK
jgi:hypothetical protein